jgi:glycosyltransferase involved in cell wall biosynthesis
MSGPALTVVVPVFNEGPGVVPCLHAVAVALRDLPPPSYLVVVDDGSSDDTPGIVDEFGDGQSIHVVHHHENRGYGAALRTGAEKARDLGSDWVLFMDSDLTNPPADIARFRALLDGTVDYVKGSRYLPPGRVVGVPWRRRIVSVVANRVAAALSGARISDLTNGFRAIRTDAFLDMPLGERGFPIIMEELYWARRTGLRIAELPTVLTNRAGDQRASSFSYRPAVLCAYARYALLMTLDRARPCRSPAGSNRS